MVTEKDTMTKNPLQASEAAEINLSGTRLQNAFERVSGVSAAVTLVSTERRCGKGERYVSAKEAEEINNFGRNLTRAFGIKNDS
jgi:hypothetical protein